MTREAKARRASETHLTPPPERRSCAAVAVGILTLATGGSFAAETPVDKSTLPPPATVKVDFARDIKPILENHCFKCHGGEKPKSHFYLANREGALKGGEHGVDLLPGRSAKSPLVWFVARRVEDMEMPPDGRGTPLTPAEIGLLRAWIDQGVPWEPTVAEKQTDVTASPTFGGTSVQGNVQKYRELYWQREGWNGGLEDFQLKQKVGEDSQVTAAGHFLLDDYKLTLAAEKNDLGFTRFGWSQFRKYYDDTGGYDPLFSPSLFGSGRDLHLDDGRLWADFGLTLPHWPRLVLGYEYQYRDGSEATLQWGPVSNGPETRDIFPAVRNLSERVHILQFDLDHEVAGVSITDNFRGEWYQLGSTRYHASGYTLGSPGLALTTIDERQTHFQGMNTVHLERQFTDWLFASGGYLYSKFSGDASLEMDTLGVASLPASLPLWQSQRIELGRESHVFSLSSLLGPWEGLSLTAGVQNEWTRQQGFGSAIAGVADPVFGLVFFPDDPESSFSDLDRATFTQDFGLRFTKIPFTTLFADARFQQESIGQSEAWNTDINSGYLLNTEATSVLRDLRVGFNTSPWRRVSFSAHYRHYDKASDYDPLLKETVLRLGAQPFEGYPGFIRSRDLLSDEAVAKLAVQCTPWLKTTFTYQHLANDYRTATDPVTGPFPGFLPGGISPGGSVLGGRYTAHVPSVNAILTPWRRLFLSTTFSYQHARTVTWVSDGPSIAPYEGDITSVIASATYALDEKTDLSGGYSFSLADFTQNNLTTGLPLGLNYQQHGLEAGIKRQIAKGKSVGLQYRFYHYAEPRSGGFNNFDAHAVFATLTVRLP